MANCINLQLPIVIFKQDAREASSYFFSEQKCDLEYSLVVAVAAAAVVVTVAVVVHVSGNLS